MLPLPDAPTMASISPFRTWKDKFSKTTSSERPELYTLRRFSTFRMFSVPIGCNQVLLRYCFYPLPARNLLPRRGLRLPPGAAEGKG